MKAPPTPHPVGAVGEGQGGGSRWELHPALRVPQPARCHEVLRNVKWGREKGSSRRLVLPVAVTYRNARWGPHFSLWAPWLGC